MEIKPQELRIGNLVKWGVHECIIKGIHTDTVTGKDPYVYGSVMIGAMPIHTIEGIDLTPEWLEKLGFNKSQHIFKTAFWNIDVVGHQLMINPENGAVVIAFDGNQIITHAKIQYIHQLQNLYFALTGKELAIDNKSI